MFRPGIGTGAREVEHVSPEGEVDTPLSIYKQGSRVLTTQILLAYGLVSLGWICYVWTRLWWRGLPFWYSLWAGVRSWAVTLPLWPFLLAVSLSSRFWFGYLLVWKRWRLELVNKWWPPAYQPVDAAEVGFLTPRRADQVAGWQGILPWWLRQLFGLLDEEEEEPAPTPGPSRRIDVRVTEKEGKRQTRVILPEYEGLASFAHAATNGRTFSQRTAASFGIDREQFNDMRDQFIDRRWAVWKVPGSPTQGVVLLAAGRAALRGMATPPP
jgi:hypothetical protein